MNVVGSAKLLVRYRTIPVRDYFLNTHRFATGRVPVTEAVYRRVIWPSAAFGAMPRLFAAPTQAELARGVRFVSSGGNRVQEPHYP